MDKIKITAKNKKLNGTFMGNITFKNGVAKVEGADVPRAIVFAERSGLNWEEDKPKTQAKKKPATKTAKKESK